MSILRLGNKLLKINNRLLKIGGAPPGPTPPAPIPRVLEVGHIRFYFENPDINVDILNFNFVALHGNTWVQTLDIDGNPIPQMYEYVVINYHNPLASQINPLTSTLCGGYVDLIDMRLDTTASISSSFTESGLEYSDALRNIHISYPTNNSSMVRMFGNCGALGTIDVKVYGSRTEVMFGNCTSGDVEITTSSTLQSMMLPEAIVGTLKVTVDTPSQSILSIFTNKSTIPNTISRFELTVPYENKDNWKISNDYCYQTFKDFASLERVMFYYTDTGSSEGRSEMSLFISGDCHGMFYGCTSLQIVPSISGYPSNLVDMFNGCVKVVNGALRAYNYLSTLGLQQWTYSRCFRDCGANTFPGQIELLQIPSDWK